MHGQRDDGGGRQKFQERCGHRREAIEKPPRREPGECQKALEGRQRRDERPEQPPILFKNVPDHHGRTPSRAAGASAVKIDRRVIGFASMYRTPSHSVRTSSSEVSSKNCVSTNMSTFPATRACSQCA